MEMKEIYPKLPTAPHIEDQGQGYRLQKINEIQAFLDKETGYHSVARLQSFER